MDDEAIRAALRRGDTDVAFRIIRQLHGNAIYSACYRMLRSRADAEDAMQRAFIAAYENRRKLLEVHQLRGWLLRTAIRKCIDAQRSAKRTSRRDDERPGDTRNDENALQQLASREKSRALEACLAALPPDVATVVAMRFHEGMSWEQIAEAVDMPTDAVRMRVQRGAVQRLRECLAGKGFTS